MAGMSVNLDKRKINEIEHGKQISNGSEGIWGWSTASGKKRSARRAELLISYGKIALGKRVLEVGCGTGIFTEKIAKTGANITAMDISPDLLDLAKKRLSMPNVLCELGDLENLHFAENSFDSVVGVSILHHVNLKQSLKEIKKVLKSGGRIVFSEPNALNPQIMLQEKIPPIRKFVEKIGIYSRHEKAFSRWTARKYLKSCGFTNITIIPFDWLHPFTTVPLITLVEKIGNFLENTTLIKEFAGSLLIYAENNK